jgi:L-lactate permease
MRLWLCSKSPSLTIHLGTFGSFSLSTALVLQLQGLLSLTGANWTVELLYMPCLVPFVLVSGVTLVVFRADMHQAGETWKEPFSSAWNKLKGMPLQGDLPGKSHDAHAACEAHSTEYYSVRRTPG